MSIINAVGLLIFCILAVVVAAVGKGTDILGMLIGVSVYLIAMLANAVVAWLLIKLLRESRPAI